MDARCRIELLGGLRLRHDTPAGEAPPPAITRFRTQKTASLLAYLAFHCHRLHAREELVELLWPDDLDTGRHNLSVALSSLRQELEPPGVPVGAALITERLAVGLNSAAVSTDVAEFEAALREAGRATAARDETGRGELLERAVALYQGPLLPGYYEDWIPAEQQRLHELYLQALRQLAVHREQEGDPEGALQHALRAVSADPLREDAHRDLMRLYLAAAQPSAALRQYRELERILREELGAVPSAATQTLVREARAGDGKLEIGDWKLKIANCSDADRAAGRPRLTAAGTPSSDQSAIINFQSSISNFPTPILPLEPVGGAVPLGSSFYIERSTDAEFVAAMTRRDSIVLVKGARQVGKTSLLARGLQQAREQGARVIQTDFQTLNAAHLESIDTLLLALAEAVGEQLDLAVMPADIWEARRGANPNFRRYLRREVLGKVEAPVVWGLDEVDRLFTVDFGSEVLALFRSWHNERALDPSGPWARMTLAIAYATEAHLFITDLNQSPFNVGTRLELEDFTVDQVADLNHRYGSPLRDGDELARCYRLLGGHPYLVRRGLHEMATRNIALDAIEAHARRDDGPFGDHLRRMLAQLGRDPDLRDAMQAVLRGSGCPQPDHFYRLRSAGVLAGETSEEARCRCQLYAAYLAERLR